MNQHNFHPLVFNTVSECCWEKSHDLKIWSESPGVHSVSSVFQCCCLSVNFHSDRVRLFILFLNFWTFSTISSFFLFTATLFIFVLDPFPSCFLSDLTPSIILNFFCSFNLSSSSFPIDFKYTQIVPRKKVKKQISQTKLSLPLLPSPAIALSLSFPSQP